MTATTTTATTTTTTMTDQELLTRPINPSFLINLLKPSSEENLYENFVYALQFGNDKMAEKYFIKILAINNDNKNNNNDKDKFNFTIPVRRPNIYYGDEKCAEVITNPDGVLSPITALIVDNVSFIDNHIPQQFKLKWLNKLFANGARIENSDSKLPSYVSMYNHSILCLAISWTYGLVIMRPESYYTETMNRYTENFEIVKFLLNHGAAQNYCRACGSEGTFHFWAQRADCYHFPELYYLLVIHGSDLVRKIDQFKAAEENKVCWQNTIRDILLQPSEDSKYFEQNYEDKMTFERRRQQVLEQFKRGIKEMRQEFLSVWLTFSYPRELCSIVFDFLLWLI